MFHLRRIIYRCTIFPPFRVAMRAFYRGAAKITAKALQRDPAVVAVYLRRGCAKGEDMPGISDVDLGAVIRGDLATHQRLKKLYFRYRRWMPVLENGIELHQEARITATHQHCQGSRFRYEEGKTGFVRLTGPPIFEKLPPLNPAFWPDTVRNESNIWWGIFTERFLNGSEGPFDPLLDAAHCVKTIGESLRTRCALETGTLPRTRREALAWAVDARGTDHELASLALDMLDHRFRGVVIPDFWEQTALFLLNHAAWLHETLEKRGPEANVRQLPQSVEDDPRERVSPVTLPGTTTFRSVLYPVGTSAIVLALSEWSSLAEMRKWVREARSVVGPNVPLFFRRGNLFFRVGESTILSRGQTVLHPLVNPEVFTPEFPMKAARWTEYQEAAYVNWRKQRSWLNEQVQMMTASSVPLRREWLAKAVQLEAIRLAAERGEVVYPLTLPAVARAADREGIALPVALRPLFSPDPEERARVPETVLDKTYAELCFLQM